MSCRRVILVIATCLIASSASAQSTSRYAGRPLADALRDLQARGLKVVFSSELVKPAMRVAIEPKATMPRKILDEILEPHRLRVMRGAKGALLVVRAPRRSGDPPAPTIRVGTIRGTVVDKRTGVPLPGVRVTVQGTLLTTVSEDDGTFVVANVPAEPQSLFISLVGYGLARPIVSVEPDQTVEITIALADGLGSYSEEVIVVADQFRGADPAVPVQQTLTNADLQDLRGVIADDPLRAVQALPNVATGDDFRSEFSVRASDFRHIGLSLDGVPIGWFVHLTRGLQDTGSVSILNGDVIERATLLSGPYPQRAPGRTGAWLSLDLQDGSRTATQGHLSVSGTTASISVNGPLGSGRRGSWLFSARQSYLQWILHRLDPSGGSAFGFSDVVGKLTYDLTSRQQLRVSVLAGRSKLDEEDENPGPNAVGEAVNHTTVATAEWRWTLSRAVVTQRGAIRRGNFTNTGQFGQVMGFGHESSGWYTADVRSDLGRGVSLSAGGTLHREELSQTSRQFAFGPTPGSTVILSEDALAHASWTSAAYAGLAWQRAGGASVDGGIGVSHSSGVGSRPASGWLLGAWPVGRGVSLRAGASVAWQFPDAEQRSRFGEAAPIRPERGVSVDLGIEQRLSSGVRWQATLFSRDERDVLRLDDAEPRLVGSAAAGASSMPTWRNALSGYARGVELVVQRRAASGLAGWAAYSYGRARQTDAAAGESFWSDFDQRHAFNTYALYRFTPKTSLSGKLRLGSNFPLAGYFARDTAGALVLSRDRNRLRLPAYSRMDMRVNHTFTFTRRRLTLFVEVMNVLGHTNYGPTDGTIRTNGQLAGFTEKLMPFLPSIGFVFDF